VKLHQFCAILSHQLARVAPDEDVPEVMERVLTELRSQATLAEEHEPLLQTVQKAAQPLVRAALAAIRDNLGPIVEGHLQSIEDARVAAEKAHTEAQRAKITAQLKASEEEQARVEAALEERLMAKIRAQVLNELAQAKKTTKG
jgi:hypothetical protein